MVEEKKKREKESKRVDITGPPDSSYHHRLCPATRGGGAERIGVVFK